MLKSVILFELHSLHVKAKLIQAVPSNKKVWIIFLELAPSNLLERLPKIVSTKEIHPNV